MGAPVDDAPARTSIEPGPDTPIDTLFFRELADVYLLIDFISSSSERRLPLGIDLDGDGKADCESWIDRICEITWPPRGNQREVAEQARLLIHTRDALSRVAAPASGSTVAFTLMVVDQDLPAASHPAGRDRPAEAGVAAPTPAHRRRLFQRPQPMVRTRRPVHNSITGLTRYDLATQAFPELEAPAQRFALFNRQLVIGMIWSLALVVALSWYVSLGNELSRQLHQAQVDFHTGGANTQAVQGAQYPLVAVVASQASAARDWSFACNRYVAGRMNLAHWALPWTLFLPASPQPDCHASASALLSDPGANFVPQDLWAVALVNALGNRLLPACYGLLGAWAAVVRRLSARIRSSELARRDHMICWIQLGLGAVVGACIGLFVTPTGDGGPNAPGLLGTANISFSALSFLAGYGVEHVFRFFDGILGRVFSSTREAQKASHP